MNKLWLIAWVCVALVLGSVAGAWATLAQRDAAVRGWVDATEVRDLPYRLPLAGVNVALEQYTPEQRRAELSRMAQAGFVWVRQAFRWQEIEPEPGIFTWEAYDGIVADVAAQPGLQLVAVLDGTPPWARYRMAPEHPYAPPASVAEYAAFARALAARYAETITYYQIWDEPNITIHWGNLDPRPAHYAAMLREAYLAIHAVDPSASVIAAALAPTTENGPRNFNEVAFLRALYANGAGGYFDAAAAKPYGFDTGPDDRRADLKVLNFSRAILMREELVRHGDGTKPIWGSNFGWNALPEDWAGPPSIWGSVSAAEQEQFTRQAYARAAQEWPWMAGLILQHWQPAAPADDPLQGFGVARVIEAWLARGPLTTDEGLGPGLYPAQNAHTIYTGEWRFSALGADSTVADPAAVTEETENRITVRFVGTDFALLTRRDDYLSYLYVWVDGHPANALPRTREGEAFIVLTAPERRANMALIRVATGLQPGLHVAEIVHRPSRGDDRWPIAGFAVASPADTAPYDRALVACAVVGGLALLGVIGLGARLPWRKVRMPTPATLRQLADWLLSLFVAGLVLLGSLATWSETLPSLLRRDQPALVITILTAGIAALSPVAIVTLLALAALFVLIFNRPLLGLMLVIFWSAFYLSTLDLLFNTFAAVEVYLGLTVAALVARALVGWARRVRGLAEQADVTATFRPDLLDGLVLAFAVLAIVSLQWSEFRGPALRTLRVIVLEPVLFYFLIRWIRLNLRDAWWLVDTLLFTGAAIALVGLYLYVTGENVVEAEDGARRLISVYGSPNGVGLYLGRCLPFALAAVLLSPRGSWRWMAAAFSGAVMLIAVLLSQSRGAILFGLPAAFVVVLIAWRGRRATRAVVVSIVVGMIALIVLAAVLPRLGDLFGATFDFRRHLWFSTAQLLRERPLTGVGLDQFLYWYRGRYLLPEAWAEPNLALPHNVALDYWANLGLAGLGLGLALQVLFWRRLWRVRGRVMSVRRPEFALVLGLAGSMADFLAHGLVDIGYFAINLSFVFFLSLALLQWLVRREGAPLSTGDDVPGA